MMTVIIIITKISLTFTETHCDWIYRPTIFGTSVRLTDLITRGKCCSNQLRGVTSVAGKGQNLPFPMHKSSRRYHRDVAGVQPVICARTSGNKMNIQKLHLGKFTIKSPASKYYYMHYYALL